MVHRDNAVKRWFENHRQQIAPLRPIFLGDDLFACHPVSEMVTNAGDVFIFTCKPTSHKTLYELIKGAELSRHEEKVRRRNTKETFRYRWIGFEILDPKGQVKYSYELEQNFGARPEILAMTLAALNLLAFGWHAVLKLLEPSWQGAREAAVKGASFLAHILMLCAYVVFPSWDVFLESLATFTIPPELIINRCCL